jgi:Holliday junction resolvase RusA-like endonuclease
MTDEERAKLVEAMWKAFDTEIGGALKAMPEPKPDFDNIAKLVSDALNGIAYKDDSQICYGVVQKRWADVAETVVTVTTCHVENIVGSGI